MVCVIYWSWCYQVAFLFMNKFPSIHTFQSCSQWLAFFFFFFYYYFASHCLVLKKYTFFFFSRLLSNLHFKVSVLAFALKFSKLQLWLVSVHSLRWAVLPSFLFLPCLYDLEIQMYNKFYTSGFCISCFATKFLTDWMKMSWKFSAFRCSLHKLP